MHLLSNPKSRPTRPLFKKAHREMQLQIFRIRRGICMRGQSQTHICLPSIIDLTELYRLGSIVAAMSRCEVDLEEYKQCYPEKLHLGLLLLYLVHKFGIGWYFGHSLLSLYRQRLAVTLSIVISFDKIISQPRADRRAADGSLGNLTSEAPPACTAQQRQ